MANQRKHKKVNKPMVVACILFYFTLVSVWMTSGLYAKYVSADSAEDSARVAKFEVTEDVTQFSKDLLIEISPGVLSQDIQIVNNSEVAIDYTITLKNTTNNVPLTFTVDNKNEMTFSMAAGATETHSMEVVFAQENAQEYAGMVDMITISIVAEQLD